mgnify:CR=1 FL=1
MIQVRVPFIRRCGAGFTLIELMVVVAVVAVLGTIAVPAYGDYMSRARASSALFALLGYQMKMEQRYTDAMRYGDDEKCAVPLPQVEQFRFDCSVDANGQRYTVTATGINTARGYAYSIDQAGRRKTLEHPKGVPGRSCWSLKGGRCDA